MSSPYRPDGAAARESAHRAACKAALKRQRLLGILYAVAPGAKLKLPTGRVALAGEAVSEADFQGSTVDERDFGNGEIRKRAIPAWRGLRRAVERGLVLEADTEPTPPGGGLAA